MHVIDVFEKFPLDFIQLFAKYITTNIWCTTVYVQLKRLHLTTTIAKIRVRFESKMF